MLSFSARKACSWLPYASPLLVSTLPQSRMFIFRFCSVPSNLEFSKPGPGGGPLGLPSNWQPRRQTRGPVSPGVATPPTHFSKPHKSIVLSPEELHRLWGLLQTKEKDIEFKRAAFEEERNAFQIYAQVSEQKNRENAMEKLECIQSHAARLHEREQKVFGLQAHVDRLLKLNEEEKNAAAQEWRRLQEERTHLEEAEETLHKRAEKLQLREEEFKRTQEVHQREWLQQQAVLKRENESLQARLASEAERLNRLCEDFNRKQTQLVGQSELLYRREAEALSAQEAVLALEERLVRETERLDALAARCSAADLFLKEQRSVVVSAFKQLCAFREACLKESQARLAVVECRAMKVAEDEGALAEGLERLAKREAAFEAREGKTQHPNSEKALSLRSRRATDAQGETPSAVNKDAFTSGQFQPSNQDATAPEEERPCLQETLAQAKIPSEAQQQAPCGAASDASCRQTTKSVEMLSTSEECSALLSSRKEANVRGAEDSSLSAALNLKEEASALQHSVRSGDKEELIGKPLQSTPLPSPERRFQPT